MATVTTSDQHYQDIAAAIRQKTGTQTQYLPAQMAAAISGISSGPAGIVTGVVEQGQNVVDTGLSAVTSFTLVGDALHALPSTFMGVLSVRYNALVTSGNALTLTYRTSGSSTVKSIGYSGAGVSNYLQIDGGTVTWKGSSYLGIGQKMHWMAEGT